MTGVQTCALPIFLYVSMIDVLGLIVFPFYSIPFFVDVVDGGKEMQKYEHEIFLKNESELESKLAEEGMEFVDVDQKAFSDAMTNGVLAVLTDSQKALYEKISAANPDA